MTKPVIQWIDGLPLHETVRDLGWFVPATQIVHILAVTVVFGSALLLALRTYGLAGGDWTPAQWSLRLKGWMLWAVVVLLVTGLGLILGEPERTLGNRTFWIKMTMLAIGIVTTVLLTRRMERASSPAAFGTFERSAAALLVVLAMLIIFAGRWIAYT